MAYNNRRKNNVVAQPHFSAGHLKPGCHPIVLINVSVPRQQSYLFQSSPIKDVRNPDQANEQADNGIVVYTPADDPQDESGVHRMPDFRKQSRGDEMVDVLQTSELE